MPRVPREGRAGVAASTSSSEYPSYPRQVRVRAVFCSPCSSNQILSASQSVLPKYIILYGHFAEKLQFFLAIMAIIAKFSPYSCVNCEDTKCSGYSWQLAGKFYEATAEDSEKMAS